MAGWLGAAFLVAGFLLLMRLFGLVPRSREAVTAARRSAETLRSSRPSDEKELALQADARKLLWHALVLTAGGAAGVLAPLGVLWGLDGLGWGSVAEALEVAVSPAFLALVALSALVWLVVLRARSRRPASQAPTHGYGPLDRALHRVAFRTGAAQIALADVEDGIFRKLLRGDADRPVFVTGLPRCGTTFLIRCCAELEAFGSHCYRDMPFVLIPCLWSRFASRFRRESEARPRAHGDGMLVDYDSPEALEEMIWQAFWRRQYLHDRILAWHEAYGREEVEDFADFFRNHMLKIASLRRPSSEQQTRYASKNNLNIARLPLLRRLFPRSTVLVPFREPLQHSASLLRQHRNFLEIHARDAFASEYMKALGHYDFGVNLRPVDFDGWLDRRETTDSDCLMFWLEYWTATYSHLLAHRQKSGAAFLSFDTLCAQPERTLRAVAAVLDCTGEDDLMAAAQNVHPPKKHAVDAAPVPSRLLDEALNVHSRLLRVAIA